jgi:perosamine synthetase
MNEGRISPQIAPRSETRQAELAADFVDRLRLVVGSRSFAPLHEPEFAGEEWTLVKDCLDTGWVSSVGKYVDRFEAEVAERCGAPYGIAVVNGTAALHAAFRALSIEPADEIIMPALTFVATANAAMYAGAVPHFVDSAMDTLGMDPVALRTHLERVADRRAGRTINAQTGRPIAAIVPMHAFGHPVDMDAILAVAAEFEIPVVEDAAESLGSLYKGRRCGGIGRVGVLSFNGNKIVTTGGGGAVVTNDPDLAHRIKHLTTTAKTPHRWAFNHDEVGYNYRLPNINAALGCAQLARLDNFVRRKRRLAARYFAAFAGCDGLTVFREPSFATSNYWLNAVLLDESETSARDVLLAAANDAGLMCRPPWILMHRLPMYEACPRATLSTAEAIEARLINIPSSATLEPVGP